MKIFLDSISLNEIEELKDFIDGVTTNPSLIAKSGNKDRYEDLLNKIHSIINGPISVEVVANNHLDMIKKALSLVEIGSNIVIKLPSTKEGLIACKRLWKEYKISVNITLCFSLGQALLAAKAGAFFVSPFLGRLNDISSNDASSLIRDICRVYSNYHFNTKVLVASIRNPIHVVEAARLGADSITLPAKILRQLFNHPLTDQGISIFERDWNAIK